MMNTDTSVVQERIGQLCHQFKLPTVAAETTSRFTEAGHGDALPTLLEVLEQEAEDRRQRRIIRLLRESRLPLGKTWETPVFTGAGSSSTTGCPWRCCQQLDHLAQGSFRGARRQRPGLRTARHRQDPRPVRPGPPAGGSRPLRPLCPSLPLGAEPAPVKTGELLAAKRDLDLPRRLRKLDNFDFLLLDDLGYLPQGAEESEVLFTLIAERYERRSLGITSNLVFSEWDRIFANPMATAAAIDRVVHHSAILEFDVPSYRTDAARQRGQAEEVNRQN